MSEPAPRFTDEDRADLLSIVDAYDQREIDVPGMSYAEDAQAIRRALAYIKKLEALRTADAMPTRTLYQRERRADALATARAALKPAPKKTDGE